MSHSSLRKLKTDLDGRTERESHEVTQRLGRDSSNWRCGMRSWRCQVVVMARQRASSCVPQPTSAQLLIVTLPGSALPSPAQPCPARTVNPCQLYSSLPALLPAEPLSLFIILSSYSTSFFTSASPWPRDCCFASFEASLFPSLPESPTRLQHPRRSHCLNLVFLLFLLTSRLPSAASTPPVLTCSFPPPTPGT